MLKKLIKFHFNYIFNKISLSLFLLLSIFIFLSNIFVIIGIDKKAELNDAYLYYLDSSFSIVSFVGVLFSIIIFSFPFLQKQDQYIYLVLSDKITRKSYFLSKYFTIALLLLIFVVLMVFSFYLPTIFFNKIKYIDIIVLKSFFDLYLMILFYGSISLLLTIVFDSIYIMLIPFTIFLIISNFNQSTSSFLNNLINNVTINIEPGKWILEQGKGKTFIIILVIFSINCLIYQKKDF